MAESMLEALTTYYRDQGILSTHFTCPHRTECEGDCATFTGPKSAFVSTGYERHDLPRVLFLSLDSGGGATDDSERLPPAVRRQEEVDFDVLSITGREKNHHWYRTHELAWYILRRFNSKIRIEDAKKYFAHANSAKCCMNKPRGKEADDRLFINCQSYLRGELAILAPDILVTQGRWGKAAVEHHYDIVRRIDGWAAIIRTNAHEVFWLHTDHPAYFGRFNRQRAGGRGWEQYSELMYEFGEQCGWPGT